MHTGTCGGAGQIVCRSSLLEGYCHVLLSGKCLWREANFWESDHHFEMTLQISSGCSFLGGRYRAPWGPWLSLLTPITSLPYFNIIAAAGITQYLSKTDPQVPSLKKNLAHHFCPKYIFSQTFYDLNRQNGTGAQEVEEQCCLAIWELR